VVTAETAEIGVSWLDAARHFLEAGGCEEKLASSLAAGEEAVLYPSWQLHESCISYLLAALSVMCMSG